MTTPLIDQLGLLKEIKAMPTGSRRIVAIAGAPGSGKSTLADKLADDLNAEGKNAAVLPMDGYHYDDGLLNAWGIRKRKGAPETFDVDGFAYMLRRLSEADAQGVAVPVFDRDLEIARAGARIIEAKTEIIIAEGNYLLLDETPWRQLQDLFDLKVFLDVPQGELRRRLRARWEGYGMDEAGILQKLDENDLPNGHRVIQNSIGADVVLSQKEVAGA
ncbi:MAG: nucleoside triphosphate hydrolase [Pseudomonadota bacterium]